MQIRSSATVLPPGIRAVAPFASGASWRISLLVCSLILSVITVQASAATEDETTRTAARQEMPLKVANRTIIVLRGPIFGYTAMERAARATERIEQVLDTELFPVVTTEEQEDGTRVLLGGKHVFLVTRIDIDQQAGETTKVMAREAAKRLEAGIRELREQEEPRFLARAAAFCALATLIYGAVLWVIIRLNTGIGKRLSAAAATRSQKIHLGGISIFDSGQVILFSRRLITLVTWVVAVVLASGWLTFVLTQFPYTRPWGERVGSNLLNIVREVVTAIVGALPGLLFAVVIFALAQQMIRLTAVFFDRVQTGRLGVSWLDTDTVKPTRRIFNAVIWVFALAMAYPYLPGAQTEAFKGLSLLIGLMLSLGSSSIIAQAFSGVILTYTRAFRRGDYVRIGDHEGTVVDLGMFTTRIQTGLGEELSLPNAGIMAGTIKNYSRSVQGPGYIVHTAVTIGYSVPWRQVHAMLEEAARGTVGISQSPPPVVRQTALDDFYVQYRLIAYSSAEDAEARVEVLNELHGRIQDVFNEHGVQIMSPHYMVDPKEPQVVPKHQWYGAPARPSDHHKPE